ncbi:MAG TPA: ABC transporter substrate-binding protein [Stellaceae bacterium]|nr:ABC transporter substrate-binding protein [Stellaceae bacterium]
MRVWFVTLLSMVVVSGAAHAADHLRVSKPSAIDFYFAVQDVGIQQDIFKKYDLDIETITLDGSAKQHQAMTAGSTDIAMGAGPDMQFIAKGVPEKAVSVMAGPPVNMFVITGAKSGIKNVSDLKGKSVGVSTMGSLTYWLAIQFAKHQGWSQSDIKIVPMGNIQAEAAAFASGNLDAAVASLEGGLTMESKGQAHLFKSFDFVNPFLVHVFFATNELTEKHPDALKRYLKAWFETVAYVKAHKDDTLRITREVTRLPQDEASRVYDVIAPTLADNGRFDPKALASVKQSMLDLGQVDKLPDNKDLYTEAYLP